VLVVAGDHPRGAIAETVGDPLGDHAAPVSSGGRIEWTVIPPGR